MADPNGWPDEALNKALLAAATRMRDACQWGGPPEDWLLDAARILDEDFADLIAARVAEARAKALEEAAAVAEGNVYRNHYRTWPWWINPDGSEGNRSADSDIVRHCDKIATAIRALKEAPHG